MAVQDYEMLLRVRADMIQAINGLDNVRKKLDDAGKEAKEMGDKGGKAVDAMSSKFGKLKTLIAGLAIGAGIRAVFGAVQESEDAVAQLNARLKSTGSAAGLSRDQLIDLSAEMQNLTTYGDEAVLSMETLLLTFTNIRGPVFRDATKVVLDMSVALGQDLKSSATQVGKALNDPILGITALSKVGVNFTAEQKDLIKSLVDTGQTAAAQTVILQELQKEYGGAAEAAGNTLGGALSQLKNAAGDLLEGDGGNLTETTGSIKDLTTTLRDPSIKEGFNIIINGLIAIAGKAAEAIGALGHFATSVADAFRDDGQKTYDGLLQKLTDLQAAQDVSKNSVAAKLGWNKGEIEEREKEIDSLKNRILEFNKVRDKAAAPPQGTASAADPVGTLPTVVVHPDKADSGAAAADDTRKFIAAAADLQKQLTDLQGSMNPAAAAWNTYNAAVARANASADLAKKANGANVESIEAQRKATIHLAATIRDAAIDKLSAADREAWDKLRDSLRTPVEIKLDEAKAQIQQLNDLMAKTPITAAEYSAALQRIGTGSVTAAPQYQGVDAAVGGPIGELSKNFAAGNALESWYAEQQKHREDDLANEEAYQARMAEIDRQYSEQKLKIEQGRQQLTLSASADFFGQLANLQHSSNNKIARIGKAAAIAQAIINTYQAATAAFAAMASIPYVGPALGAAAAAVAIATGLANVAQIRAQPDSYDTGGYTGPGGRLEPAGIVHRGEVVWSQSDIRRAGGVGVVEALRLGYPPYADGGFVDGGSRAANSITPDFDGIAARQQSAAPNVQNNFRFISAFDANELAQRILETPAGEKAVVNHVIANSGAVKRGLQ